MVHSRISVSETLLVDWFHPSNLVPLPSHVFHGLSLSSYIRISARNYWSISSKDCLDYLPRTPAWEEEWIMLDQITEHFETFDTGCLVMSWSNYFAGIISSLILSSFAKILHAMSVHEKQEGLGEQSDSFNEIMLYFRHLTVNVCISMSLNHI